MIWWIKQIDWMIFVYWEWWISIEATKICYFGLALSGIGSQPTRLSDVLNLKNVKTIWGIKLIFCLHWSYKNIILFWFMPGNTLGQSVCRIFYFVWLVNLNTGGPLLYCTCLSSIATETLLRRNTRLHNLQLIPYQECDLWIYEGLAFVLHFLFWALVALDEDDDPATAEEFWILSFSLFVVVDAKIF